MTTKSFDDFPVHERRLLVVHAVLRTIATVALVVAIYFLVPMDRAMTAATVTELVLGVLVLFAVVAWQIRRIIRSDHPGIRGVEALAFTLPLFILLFATAYYLMGHAQPTTFAQPLSRIDSMYFSATVFTTVGFGDIAARGEAARVVVTLQMMLDLVVVGLVVRLVVNAIKIGKQRQVAQS
jgi:voltage-gated potassium channel